MRIKNILKDTQSKEYKKLKSISNKKHKRKKENLSERDLKDLMSHSSYIRGKRGAIKQVR